MQRIALALGSAWLLTACGGTNLNSFFVSEEQKKAQDQLRIQAQYEYDQGNNDKALEITDEILKMNPYEETALILRSYAYLSKAGLDAFSLSKNLIEQSENKDKDNTTKSGDATADNLNALATVIGLSTDDFNELGTPNTVTGTNTTVYYPKSRTDARVSLSCVPLFRPARPRILPGIQGIAVKPVPLNSRVARNRTSPGPWRILVKRSLSIRWCFMMMVPWARMASHSGPTFSAYQPV
jgi:hypothetical protein